jgi:hypothetical protein
MRDWRLSLILPAVHLVVCAASALGLLGTEGSWQWFFVFVIDFPFSIALIPVVNVVHPLLAFGVLGTLWWYLINWLVVSCFRRTASRRQSP